MRAACLESRCPGYAVHRGRCEVHRQTEPQRGYGGNWKRLSRELRVGQVCAICGTANDLTVDHVTPHSLERLRVLCRSCHGRHGARRDREATA
jgi:5-methylcytosine-specific restriction endonuclease McrA